MILVTGAGGQLGSAFLRLLGDQAAGATRADLDLTAVESIRPFLDRLEPTLLINCAAYTAVDRAENDEDRAFAINAVAVRELAAWCVDAGTPFVTFSTDYVFDGRQTTPYFEDADPNPLGVYGKSKVEGERFALEVNPGSLVIRTSWVLSGDHPNFASAMLRLAPSGNLKVVADQTGVPNFVDQLASATMQAIQAKLTGVLHLSGPDPTTWHALARAILAEAGHDADMVAPITTEEFGAAAPRPLYGVLASNRAPAVGIALESWRQSLPATVKQLQKWV